MQKSWKGESVAYTLWDASSFGAATLSLRATKERRNERQHLCENYLVSAVNKGINPHLPLLTSFTNVCGKIRGLEPLRMAPFAAQQVVKTEDYFATVAGGQHYADYLDTAYQLDYQLIREWSRQHR